MSDVAVATPKLAAAPVRDWQAFYATVTAGGAIPFRPVADYRRDSAVASDMLLSLPEVIGESRAGRHNARLVTLFADVVTLPSAVSLTLTGGGLFIAARRIEVGAPLSIQVGANGSGMVVIAAQEVNQPLLVTVTDASGTRTIDLTPRTTIARSLTATKGKVSVTDLAAIHASYDWDTPLRRCLCAILQYGTACFDLDPAVAGQMFSFVLRVTGGVDTAVDLHGQAAALLASLNASTSPTTVVPYLSDEVYKTQARAFADAAYAYEQQYQIYASSSADAKARLDAAALMLARYADTANFNATLADQARRNLADAQSSAVAASLAMSTQKHDADIASIEFEYNAKTWAREKQVEAAFAIIGAVISVAGAAALMACGDEAAGASATKGVAEAAKAGEAAAEVAKKGGEMGKLGKAVESVAAQMSKLKDVAEAIGKMGEAMQKILEAVNSTQGASGLASIELPASGMASTDAQWDAFLIDCTTMLQPAIDAGVPGGREYLAALQKLVVFGKAAMAAQVSVIQVGQEVLRLSMQQQIDQMQHDRIQAYMDQLRKSGSANDALGDIFFARQLSMRLWLFLALKAYAGAFRYWALRPSGVTASMITPIAQLRDDLAGIEREYAGVLDSFNPAPLEFKRMRVAMTATTNGRHAGFVDALRKDRKATVALALDEPVFRGWGRVRLTAVRAWLHGVAANEDRPVTVDIETSGYFEDRRGGRVFAFSAAPVKRTFRYASALFAEDGIQVEGFVEQRERLLLFQPTPFTQWTPGVDAGVDLTGLSGITLEFYGSAIRDMA